MRYCARAASSDALILWLNLRLPMVAQMVLDSFKVPQYVQLSPHDPCKNLT